MFHEKFRYCGTTVANQNYSNISKIRFSLVNAYFHSVYRLLSLHLSHKNVKIEICVLNMCAYFIRSFKHGYIFSFLSEIHLFQATCVLTHVRLYASLQVRLCSPPFQHMEGCCINQLGKQFCGRQVYHHMFTIMLKYETAE
jgi:hypothetical protein